MTFVSLSASSSNPQSFTSIRHRRQSSNGTTTSLPPPDASPSYPATDSYYTPHFSDNTSTFASPIPSQTAGISSTVFSQSTPSASATGNAIPPSEAHSNGNNTTVVAIGTLVGILLFGVFVWLLRRGTFGSGTLFGFKYGDARYPDWGGHQPGRGAVLSQMRETPTGARSAVMASNSQSRSARNKASGSMNRSTVVAPTVVAPTVPRTRSSKRKLDIPPPSFPARMLMKPSSAYPRDQDREKWPLSPTAWSTSPSAFDNAYGALAAPSEVMSVSDDLSTLVSERGAAYRHSLGSRVVRDERQSLTRGQLYMPVPVRAGAGAGLLPEGNSEMSISTTLDRTPSTSATGSVRTVSRGESSSDPPGAGARGGT